LSDDDWPALFLLLSGLPWSANWGRYLTWARNHWSVTAGTPASSAAPGSGMPGISAAEMASISPSAAPSARPAGSGGPDLQALDRIAPAAAVPHPPRPIWISPPARGFRDWTISSQIQNRPLRVT
jgi:uncharacterized iron-regulated membrane protein